MEVVHHEIKLFFKTKEQALRFLKLLNKSMSNGYIWEYSVQQSWNDPAHSAMVVTLLNGCWGNSLRYIGKLVKKVEQE